MNTRTKTLLGGFLIIASYFAMITGIYYEKILVKPTSVMLESMGAKPGSVVIHYKDRAGSLFIKVTIDGKEMEALYDTGATDTSIDSKLTGVPGREARARDFHGDTVPVRIAGMKVCVESLCDYEEVSIVKGLIDKAVLRGSFFNRARTMTINYRDKIMTIEGWER